MWGGGIIFFWIESNDRTLITPSNKKEKIEDYKKNPLPLKKGVGRRGFRNKHEPNTFLFLL